MALLSEQIQQLIDYKGGTQKHPMRGMAYYEKYGDKKPPSDVRVLLRCLEIIEVLEEDSRVSPTLYKLLEPLDLKETQLPSRRSPATQPRGRSQP